MYRVDTRNFNIDDIITPPENNYQDAVNFNAIIETTLLEQRPVEKNNADRRTGLFIFTELSDAIRFSCRMTNSKIYKVRSLPDTTPFHKGDMNWTEVMSKLMAHDIALRQIADLYWTNGCKTFKPCWEVIVNRMQVVSLVIATEEQRIRMRNEFSTTPCNLNVENLTVFLEELSRQ